MRLIVTTFVTFTLLFGGGCSRGKPETPAGGDGAFRWHTYLDMARREAQRDDRRIFAAFYSVDCPVCKSMDDSVFATPDVREVLSDLVAVRISVDTDSATTESLRVREHPTVVFLEADGSEIDRIVGYSTAPAFSARAREILGGRASIETMLAGESSHAGDTPFLLELAQKLYHRREYDGAVKRLDAIVAADPANRLAATDKALFLKGRILNEQSRFEESIVPLTTLIEDFPASDLVAEAHLYRAVSLLSIRGRNQEGVNELALIIKEYPGTRVATWAREQLDILSRGRSPAPASPPARRG